MTEPTEAPDPCWKGVDTVTGEPLKDQAATQLKMIDDDREAVRLLAAGVGIGTIAQRLGMPTRRVEVLKQDLAEGKEIRPETPEEIGYRRAVGQITTEEMMNRLRTWPYTFGRVMYDFYDRGTWDDVRSLYFDKFITLEEMKELEAITDPMPKPEDVL